MGETERQDEGFMRRALALAARGRGRVEPNPMVGCVLVRRGRIVGEGWHRRFGGPHAERDALRRCEGSVGGATAYVTLEPCCHYGKTPPCTEALIEAGVARVVAAVADPFAAVRGRGIRTLREAGIRVDVGVCPAEAERLNAAYFKLRHTGRPWVILKWAQSLDGKIATRTGDSRWITGAAARREAHRLRGRVDAVVVGIGTVLADDPDLTCRHVRAKRVATRIVLDGRLRIPRSAKLVKTARQAPVLVVTAQAGLRGRSAEARRLRSAGCEVIGIRGRGGRIDLGALLDELGRREMTNVMVEGGGEVLGAFFDEKLADEALVFVAPKLIGGREALDPLAGRGIGTMAEAVAFGGARRRWVGEDQMISFRLSDDLGTRRRVRGGS
ncbi:MAG: bifunctional diaminohydroxyphosphoribosylaminopyrimidine deaminase/5-amino-6-(5-phosphoribosylamino)uracil reductase RibD [Phycisphaerae bacterium]|nr:bifunctional diaminohydroxyphosphoribosylaminopyrimidine deaminase/5-amino-6-(5-phosphoribosylamino)uracil reductase RibD [Phycisphaerae bacterium]